MANHGRTGADLQKYLETKSVPRERRVFDPKTNTFVKQMVDGRYEKKSYLDRAKKRSKAK